MNWPSITLQVQAFPLPLHYVSRQNIWVSCYTHISVTNECRTMTDLFCRGERTASAMESQLTALEQRIDDLLASVDEQSGKVDGASNEKAGDNQVRTKDA